MATGILLAGGQSKRMGTDKAFVKLHGKNLVEYPLAALKKVCTEVLIVTKTPELYQPYPAKVLEDEVPDAGPLGGILTGLKAAKNFWSIVLACDMPYVRRELLEALLDEGRRAEGLKAIVPLAPASGRHEGVQAHPLCALYCKGCLPVVRAQILKGDLSLKQALLHLEAKFQPWLELDPDDAQAISFMNVNRPEDVGIAAGAPPPGPIRRSSQALSAGGQEHG